MNTHPPAQHIRYVSCLDVFGGKRRARVLRDGTLVVIVVPAGEVAMFTVHQARDLATAITTAITTVTGIDQDPATV